MEKQVGGTGFTATWLPGTRGAQSFVSVDDLDAQDESSLGDTDPLSGPDVSLTSMYPSSSTSADPVQWEFVRLD